MRPAKIPPRPGCHALRHSAEHRAVDLRPPSGLYPVIDNAHQCVLLRFVRDKVFYALHRQRLLIEASRQRTPGRQNSTVLPGNCRAQASAAAVRMLRNGSFVMA